MHFSFLAPPRMMKQFFIISQMGKIEHKYCVRALNVLLSLSTMPAATWAQYTRKLLYLLLSASFSHTEKEDCLHRGDLEDAQLFKNGDIMLGGVFSFHSSWRNIQENYEQKPQQLQCTR